VVSGGDRASSSVCREGHDAASRPVHVGASPGSANGRRSILVRKRL
jgi:hypothetical protein